MLYLILLACVITFVSNVPLDAVPIKDPWAHHREGQVEERNTTGLIGAVNFMKKFGYIPPDDGNASFIITEEGIKERLKLVQKFGALPQTGELDKKTIELMSKPRCGVHDVAEPPRRKKRYIVGAKGWNKRKLTYHVANWSPKLWSKDNVQRELKRAFSEWTKYSYLQFEEVADNTADIIIFFSSYHHGDGYPFDGQGGILAHAYYPYEHGHYGGDIHFDESEDWVVDPKDEHDGLDFFTVAVHEIGHSLGLAHSPVPGSIMFPYYKGFTDNFALDYDDVMGMWDLYIRRKLEGDDEFFNTTTVTTTSTTSTTPAYDVAQNDATDETSVKSTNPDDDKIVYHGDSETVDQHKKRTESSNTNSPSLPPLFPETEDDIYAEDRRKREEEERRREEERQRKWQEEEERRQWQDKRRREEEARRRQEEEERIRWEEEEKRRWDEWENGRTSTFKPSVSTTDVTIPDVCHGVDSVATIRSELFFFKGKYIWRFERPGVVMNGYPAPVFSMFPGLPQWLNKIDAVYERPHDSHIIFFIGKYYYIHDGTRLIEEMKPLTDFGLPDAITEIDAVFYWPKNNRTYIFRRNLYWRRNDEANKMEENYPQGIDRWNGIPQNIDAAFTDTKGITHFFKENGVWQYDNQLISPTRDSPSTIGPTWFQCK